MQVGQSPTTSGPERATLAESGDSAQLYIRQVRNDCHHEFAHQAGLIGDEDADSLHGAPIPLSILANDRTASPA
jgi:hypothetical protein